jgi:acetoin utilization protein AcuC
VALGGGGYEVGLVVPRSWTHLLAELTGEQVNGATPADWQQEVLERVGGPAPLNLTDLEGGGTEPIITAAAWEGSTGTPLDESIDATRSVVFPFHGLVP